MAYIPTVQRVVSSGTAKTASEFTVPGKATHVEIQVDANSVRYTMDGTTPTSSLGMLFLITEGPKTFLIEDFKNIKFISGSGDGGVNVHFFAGRDV